MLQEKGFSLFELIITICLIAIVSSMSVPSMRQLLDSNRVRAQTGEIVGATQMARNVAVARNIPVTVCAKPNPGATQCTEQGSPDWVSGWLVFVDSHGAVGQIDPGDEVIRIYPTLQGGASLTGTRAFITYEGSGMLQSEGATLQLRQSYCRLSTNRDIHIPLGGHHYVQSKSC